MTVGTTISSISVAGNGATTTFAYPFLMPGASDAVVTYTAVGGVQTVLTSTEYTIFGVGNAAGGTVLYPTVGSPIPSGAFLTIQRVLPVIQGTSVSNQGPTFAAIEGALDYLTMLIQEVDGLAERAIVINPADINLPTPLPPAAERANQFLYFDVNGNPTAASAVTGTVVVSSAMQPVVAASTVQGALALLGGAIAFSNIAGLRAYTGTAPPVIYVAGYYTVADGGDGNFVYATGDTTSADNGGTIIVDAAGRRWYLETAGGPVSLRQFGAKGDGVTDDTAAIQACINAAGTQGFGIRHPIGVFVVSSTLSSTNQISWFGINPGVGPGIVSAADASVLLCANAFTAGDVISVTSYYGSIFRDFQIAGALGLTYTNACPRTAGAGIHITGPTGHVNMNSEIKNVCFSGIFLPIQLTRCQESTLIDANYFQAWGNGSQSIYADNGGTSVESSHGQITNNHFQGNPAGTQGPCIEAHCGYGGIHHNKFIGAEYGIRVVADQTNIGNVVIDSGNSFEELSVQSILITQVGSWLIPSIKILGNQFSNLANSISAHIAVQPSIGGSSSNLSDVQVIANTFYTQTFTANAAFITVTASNVTIADNLGYVTGGTAYGIVVPPSSGVVSIYDNQIIAAGGTLNGTGGYLLRKVTVQLRDARAGHLLGGKSNRAGELPQWFRGVCQ